MGNLLINILVEISIGVIAHLSHGIKTTKEYWEIIGFK